MINYKSIEEIRNTFVEVRSSLDEVNLNKALGFETKKDRILSLFSIRYKDVKKLINEGTLVYSYIFKTEYHLNGNSNFFKSWILFCPSIKYEENPLLYSKIAAELEYFLKNQDKKYKKIIRKILNKDNDFDLLELPKEAFNETIFLSTVHTKEKINPNLKLGINVCLLNRKANKKVMILPEIFNKEGK